MLKAAKVANSNDEEDSFNFPSVPVNKRRIARGKEAPEPGSNETPIFLPSTLVTPSRNQNHTLAGPFSKSGITFDIASQYFYIYITSSTVINTRSRTRTPGLMSGKGPRRVSKDSNLCRGPDSLKISTFSQTLCGLNAKSTHRSGLGVVRGDGVVDINQNAGLLSAAPNH